MIRPADPTHMLHLTGGEALTPRRRTRLLERLREQAGLDAEVLHARFHYLVACREALEADAVAVLTALVGGAPEAASADGPQVVVTPRAGTISPWSSKATDIAHNCGLNQVLRLERAVVFTLQGVAPEAANLHQAAALLHDRMTQSVFQSTREALAMFDTGQASPLAHVPVMREGRRALLAANTALGLALSEAEVDYLVRSFRELDRDPTDVELMMFAQANSEHCRHKIFNARWTIDGEDQPLSLFAMIRNTHRCSPGRVLSAYSDNAAVTEGSTRTLFYPHPEHAGYVERVAQADLLMKVETHNHPTAISPFPGAATGSGGEIRDEAATGRGAFAKAGLTGFSVSNLHIPGFTQPWEKDHGRPGRIVSALEIMLEGPIGAAGFNNEFGRPALGGYFRTLEVEFDGQLRGYHKPIMIAGGMGNIVREQVDKQRFPPGTRIVVLGGPAMLIGLGGGAASSVASGEGEESLDFASVQRDNPEMQRRAQEVINRCWQLGESNPIASIHDVGAGGLSNAVPEIIDDAERGGRFHLAEVPRDDPNMSPLELWCNESQERFVLAVAPQRMARFEAICRRERCPFAVLGEATEQSLLVLDDPPGPPPIALPMEVLFGNPPSMHRHASRTPAARESLDTQKLDMDETVRRVLRVPAVADKRFLITIGDRTVTGLVCRDQMVGPWQVPVADCAITLADYAGYEGEAMAMGERTPLALLDAPASGRMAVGEALTNLAAAPVRDLSEVVLSANWMAAAGHPGEDARLFDTVRAVGIELCPRLGICIPVGKDSLSMRTVWREAGEERAVTAPVSLVVSAFAVVDDVRRHLTPELVPDEDSLLMLIDLGLGRHRLGGSALALAHGSMGADPPDLDDPGALAHFFRTLQQAMREGSVLAYHDRSDGGLLVTLCEMSFASRLGLRVELDTLGNDLVSALFCEELGAVLQVKAERADALQATLGAHSALADHVHRIGRVAGDGRIRIRHRDRDVLDVSRASLEATWSETSFHMQALRDDPDCAAEERAAVVGEEPGLHAKLSFDPAADVAARYIGSARPRVAILREQGVNGHVEMAAAFHRAGFEAVDVHMSELVAGSTDLSGFQGLVAGGGFSYGDVLGGGGGWAASLVHSKRAREALESFLRRSDTFGLGVCNGCQMMSRLSSLVPGAAHWPQFLRNRSDQFEARLSMVEVLPSPSLFLQGMAGSRLPVAVAHGEGRAHFSHASQARKVLDAQLACLRYVDGHGRVTELYPHNPNGSPLGLTGFTSQDGRFTIMMPHPERVFRTAQHSWHPRGWGEEAPWLRMFRNARRWVG